MSSESSFFSSVRCQYWLAILAMLCVCLNFTTFVSLVGSCPSSLSLAVNNAHIDSRAFQLFEATSNTTSHGRVSLYPYSPSQTCPVKLTRAQLVLCGRLDLSTYVTKQQP